MEDFDPWQKTRFKAGHQPQCNHLETVSFGLWRQVGPAAAAPSWVLAPTELPSLSSAMDSIRKGETGQKWGIKKPAWYWYQCSGCPGTEKGQFSGSCHQKWCSQFGEDGTSSWFSCAIGNYYCRGSWQLYFVSYPFCWITSTQPQLYLCKYVYIHLHTFESVYPICYS